MENFTLQHTVLYSKGWYKWSKNFWKDIHKVLIADDYQADLNTNLENAHLILSQFDKLSPRHDNKCSNVVFGIQDAACWKYGYTTKTNFFGGMVKNKGKLDLEKFPDYDLAEAIVRYCLSVFGQLTREEWNAIAPDFKVLPRKNGIKDKSLLIFNK